MFKDQRVKKCCEFIDTGSSFYGAMHKSACKCIYNSAIKNAMGLSQFSPLAGVPPTGIKCFFLHTKYITSIAGNGEESIYKWQ